MYHLITNVLLSTQGRNHLRISRSGGYQRGDNNQSQFVIIGQIGKTSGELSQNLAPFTTSLWRIAQ